jgi:hypothetical protein
MIVLVGGLQGGYWAVSQGDNKRKPGAMLGSRFATSDTACNTHWVLAAQPSAAIQLKLHFESAVEASAEGREAEDFGVFFVEQIFDPAG